MHYRFFSIIEIASTSLIAILAPNAYLNTFQSLVKFDDAALTAQNIMNAMGAFRLCILLLSIVMVLDIVVAWGLYIVLVPSTKISLRWRRGCG